MLSTIVFHTVCYYIVWFSCILSAAADDVWLGPSVAAIILMAQFSWQTRLKQTKGLLLLVFGLAAIGCLVDSVLLHIGYIDFRANPWPGAFAPPWIIAIWLVFGVVYYACFLSLFDRYILLSVLAFMGFPLAYYAGVKLGAASLVYGESSIFILGLIWAVFLPAVTYSYNKIIKRSVHV